MQGQKGGRCRDLLPTRSLGKNRSASGFALVSSEGNVTCFLLQKKSSTQSIKFMKLMQNKFAFVFWRWREPCPVLKSVPGGNLRKTAKGTQAEDNTKLASFSQGPPYFFLTCAPLEESLAFADHEHRLSESTSTSRLHLPLHHTPHRSGSIAGLALLRSLSCPYPNSLHPK